VRERGKPDYRHLIVGAAGAVAFRLWARVARRPVDSLAILAACAASLVIAVNALFLQSGMHPAPFFANPTPPPPAAEVRSTPTSTTPLKAAESAPPPPPRPTASERIPQTVSARRNDPIGELIVSSVGSPARVAAVQRVLSEFGYGQIKASGTLDAITRTAIEKFELEHKMPVTGRLSDRLLSELSAVSGRPLQ